MSAEKLVSRDRATHVKTDVPLWFLPRYRSLSYTVSKGHQVPATCARNCTIPTYKSTWPTLSVVR